MEMHNLNAAAGWLSMAVHCCSQQQCMESLFLLSNYKKKFELHIVAESNNLLPAARGLEGDGAKCHPAHA